MPETSRSPLLAAVGRDQRLDRGRGPAGGGPRPPAARRGCPRHRSPGSGSRAICGWQSRTGRRRTGWFLSRGCIGIRVNREGNGRQAGQLPPGRATRPFSMVFPWKCLQGLEYHASYTVRPVAAQWAAPTDCIRARRCARRPHRTSHALRCHQNLPGQGTGYNGTGGAMLSWLDEAGAAFAGYLCRTPNMVTLKMDEARFRRPVKISHHVRIYARIHHLGTSSLTINVEAWKAEEIFTKELPGDRLLDPHRLRQDRRCRLLGCTSTTTCVRTCRTTPSATSCSGSSRRPPASSTSSAPPELESACTTPASLPAATRPSRSAPSVRPPDSPDMLEKMLPFRRHEHRPPQLLPR